jgi:hypothetical protein
LRGGQTSGPRPGGCSPERIARRADFRAAAGRLLA